MYNYIIGFILIASPFAVLQADTLAYLHQGQKMQEVSVKHWNDSNFDQAIAKGVVVVDFYADWCGPCRKFSPVFEQVASEMGGAAVFGKVNVDVGRRIASKYRVDRVPTVILFKDGKEIKRGSKFGSADLFHSWVKFAY